MKTLLIVMIISAIPIAALGIFVYQSQSGLAREVFQYEIHQPYNLTGDIFTTADIQNQTFFVYDISRSLNTSNSTEMEWYKIKFSFPHGSELENTPGGTIFESYVTFPNDTVPYRIALSQSSLPGSPHYDFTTVLSTHANPRVGFTLHNQTMYLLVNWPKIHSDITINGLSNTYKTGQPMDFQIEVKGFDNFDGGETPRVWVERPDGSLVWSPIDKNGLTLCCPSELVNYDRIFNLTTLGGPMAINKAGSYNLMVTYNHQKIQKQFNVIPTPKTSIYDTGTLPSYANAINVIINGEKSDFSFNYTMTGGKIKEATADIINKALILSVETTENGILVADLPRSLIDAKIDDQDSAFIVLEDGQEVLFNQIITSQDRILSIPFKFGVSQIEIVAPVPIQ